MGHRLASLALALPGLVAAAASAALLVMTAAGVNPFWTPQAANISESAALRDAATVVQRIQRGEDIAAAHSVRAGILFDRAVTVTPVEAAVAARRAEVVDAILTERPFDTAEWQRVFCLASTMPDEDIREVVDAHRPEGAADGDCSSYRRPW
jgi:hypothetical protein